MSVELTVVLPTHNPHGERLARTLEGLRRQSLDQKRWQLVLVDNASTERVVLRNIDISWHRDAGIVTEEKPGLNHARRRGFAESAGEVIVLVDDDNVLASDYLERSLAIMRGEEKLGIAGGRSLGEFECEPAEWMEPFLDLVAVRDCGKEIIVGPGDEEERHPSWAPIGAGMVLKRVCALGWCERSVKGNSLTDRQGDSLSSAGDCDIVLTAVENGWRIGYFPDLILTHLIPSKRLSREYFGRIGRSIATSWVEVLFRHGIRPWTPVSKWSVGLRCMRAWMRERAWAGPAEYVRWQTACGYFEGRARIR